jgi:predicted PurR-regulated permease PerM
VILALSVFGFFFGFVGMLIAVPLAVLVKMVMAMAMERYRDSRFFRGETRVSAL